MDEQCGYCGEWGEWNQMIPVGFTEADLPQVKVWCNRLWCEYKDASIEAWQAINENL